MSQDASAAGDLAPGAVLRRLGTRRLGHSYEFLSACVSTNDVVRSRAADEAAEGLLIVADTQAAGRGRLGRSWHSPPGQNLYLSLLLRPALPARLAAPLTLLAGASLARTLVEAGVVPRLRWPNDLLIPAAGSFRKVAGILTEMATKGEAVRHIVLGVGVNVNGLAFPAELAERATSLRMACGHAFDRTQLLVVFLSIFESLYDDFLARGPAFGLAEWRRHADLGRVCRVDQNGARIEGIATDIDDSGALLVRDDAGHVHRLTSVDEGELLHTGQPHGRNQRA